MAKGPLTKDERRYIELNASQKSFAEIARKLNRDPSTIRKYAARKKVRGGPSDVEVRIKSTLDSSPHMKELRKQFTDDEMERVKHDWTNITEQFRGDILYTEEMQILDYIRIGVLMDRFLNREREMTHDLEEVDKRLDALEKLKGTDDAPTNLRSQQEATLFQKGTLLGEIGECQKGYKDLIDKRERAAKSISGSREQRSKKEQLSKKTIKDWVLSLHNDPKKRREIGEEIEKMKIGIKEEYVRLSEVHKYFNGDLDIPVLNAETVGNLESVVNAGQNNYGDGDNGPDGESSNGQTNREKQDSGSSTPSIDLKPSEDIRLP